MGYVLAHSACIGCGQVISYNPVHVPSVRHPRTGAREPVCRECITAANPVRIKNGLEPIVPHPEAYEPLDEEEMP